MSIHSTPVVDPRVLEHDTKLDIHTRPYFSAKTASEFKGVFDIMLTTRENQQILCSDAGIKSSTLYQKTQDALKFLAENGDPKYRTLRGEVSIRRKTDRIIIFFKSSITHIIARGGIVGGEAEAETKLRSWKDDIAEWIVKAKSGDVYDSRETFNGLVITEEEYVWLVRFLGGIEGTELDRQLTYFRIAR